MTRILSKASVSDWNTRYFMPRQAPSSCWNSGACMISFICAESFLSSCAIISPMVSSTSDLMTLVSASACSTSVLTAFSISVAARSVRGLKVCFRSEANSSASWVCVRASCWTVSVAMTSFLLRSIQYDDRLWCCLLRCCLLLAIAALLQRLHQLRIRQQFAQLTLRGGLAVHIALEIRQLRSCFEKPCDCRNLLCNGGRFEIRHFVEAELDAYFLSGVLAEFVSYPEVDARLDGGHSRIQIVHVEFKEFAIDDFGLLLAGRVAGEIGQDAHDEWDLDFFLGIRRIFVGDVDARRPNPTNEFLTTFLCHAYNLVFEFKMRRNFRCDINWNRRVHGLPNGRPRASVR